MVHYFAMTHARRSLMVAVALWACATLLNALVVVPAGVSRTLGDRLVGAGMVLVVLAVIWFLDARGQRWPRWALAVLLTAGLVRDIVQVDERAIGAVIDAVALGVLVWGWPSRRRLSTSESGSSQRSVTGCHSRTLGCGSDIAPHRQSALPQRLPLSSECSTDVPFPHGDVLR
jgi:hypothetical protein